ncbi:hypothetical protein CF327_g5703 [Tilletia walkeri]|nr:hypothetical protein CF327_g5703 [Tilletia walkeri]
MAVERVIVLVSVGRVFMHVSFPPDLTNTTVDHDDHEPSLILSASASTATYLNRLTPRSKLRAGAMSIPAHGGPATGDVLPLIPRIDAQDPSTLAKIQAPAKRLYTDSDLAAFHRSDAHRIFSLFITRLAEASVGKPILEKLPQNGSDGERSLRDGAERILDLLAELDRWTREIEREQGPQRFGNIAFRDWGKRLEERSKELHEKLLPQHLHPFIVELQSPFLSSFGNFTRIDYGSGHELSFAIWLCFLYRLNFFGTYDEVSTGAVSDRTHVEAEKRQRDTEEIIALLILPAYLRSVYAIQDRYSLEPAGSHGVWGLDDFQFLPYIIGSAQLSAQETFKPRDILPPVSGPPPLPNLYSLSIARILTLKHGGPFAEHSPMLTDIASSVPTWSKVLRGLLRMYEAEVLGKRVVVQLWDFGGVGWVWEGEIREATSASSAAAAAGETGRDMNAAGVKVPMAPTAAPWATASRSGRQIPTGTAMPSLASTAAPWASSASGSALGPRLGASHPSPAAAPPPFPSIPYGCFAGSSTTARKSLYSTGSAAAASSPFGSLARSMEGPGRNALTAMGARGGGTLRDPLAEPDVHSQSSRSPNAR